MAWKSLINKKTNIFIHVGGYVRNLNHNQFGIVTKQAQRIVVAKLQGEVKQLNHGRINDVGQGALFDDSSDDWAFVPNNALKRFSLQNLAVCFPQKFSYSETASERRVCYLKQALRDRQFL